MHKYPMVLFNLGKRDLQDSQLESLLQYEQIVGQVKYATDVEGLWVDFNSGVRVQVPEGNWHVRLSDFHSGLVGFDGDASAQVLVSAEKYYICWHVEVYKDGRKVFEHVLDLKDKEVYIFMASGALGDSISLFPYLRTFQTYYQCHISLYPPQAMKDILQEYYPDLSLVDGIPENAYASYCLAVFQTDPYLVPQNSRLMSPGLSARSILRLPFAAEYVQYYPTQPRRIREKYVCIGVQASGIMKRWLYPYGWDKVVAYLQELGYRVFCIDGHNKYSWGPYTVNCPKGAEDETGMKPFMERINLLSYADFFIGLPSGLTWLAYACNVPRVLISGFNLPHCEPDTPYRVTNFSVCHGCYGDLRVDWKNVCPYHRGSERELECTKTISFAMVKNAIDRLIRDYQL